MSNNKKIQKVAVAMSGGVDSSVAAILLIDFAYDKREAIDLVRTKRKGAIETKEQEEFIFS